VGTPIYAIAPGLVTYADPVGWGRDEGVVILQHTFPDNSQIFSVYGHIVPSPEIPFPTRGSCLNRGDAVGVIGEPRPAPHVHFEIRTFWGNYPGPGYWEVDPALEGWYNPSQFIENWRAWLHPFHRWHVDLNDPTSPHFAPLIRSDGTTWLLDQNYIEAYNTLGQYLWQYRLADSVIPVGFTALDDATALIGTSDGRIQYWRQGGYQEQWETGLNGMIWGPVVFGDSLLMQDELNTLHFFNTQQQPFAQHPNLGTISAYAITPTHIALLTSLQGLLIFNMDGTLAHQLLVDSLARINSTADGQLILLNNNTLGIIAPDGNFTPILSDLILNRTDHTVYITNENTIILFGVNGNYKITALNLNGQILWENEIRLTITNPTFTQANACTLILADQTGQIFWIDALSGEIKTQIDVWGTYRNNTWVGTIPNDNLLRIQVGNQLTGFDLGPSCP
jgi:hypothetical protein